jgi:hypothetical protein
MRSTFIRHILPTPCDSRVLKRARTEKMIQSLDSSYTPDDTCAVWSKRINEEANAKQNLREEVPTSAIREARECQAPQVTIVQGFCAARQ